ncbi:uncharacterized protein LOC108603861 [Drosophila busckii]|uniref:uncharacterized protein LOC108603861 n=1 Tax=Drosophila busckii TaxID=30019 RepID=UPI00083EAF5D|nr:uncharacterized protein LOC108603861 [Drosophila busckii]
MVTIRNEQNISVPKYLDEQFFVDALEEGLRETKLTLYEINFEWGSNPGDNYCSAIYRVQLSYARWINSEESSGKDNISLIVKTISSDKQFLEDVRVFIKERQTYTDVLPRLEILTNGDRFGAKYFHPIKTPVQTIVFGDLKLQGFRTASREAGLDWEHASLILQQLGKFHATSMVLAKKEPSIVDQYHSGLLSEATLLQSDGFSNMFKGFLKGLIQATARWPGYEHISQHLQRYMDNFQMISLAAAQRRANDRYIVLNHGDMWINNFMYAYENKAQPETPTGAIFVDFQLCFYGSPGCDLNFFLNNCVKLELLQKRRTDIIKAYYKAFSEALAYARYESIPSYEDLLWELRSREIYGLFALFGFLPIVTMPKQLAEDNSMESLNDETFMQKKLDAIFKQKFLNDYYKWCLKRADEVGIFNDY